MKIVLIALCSLVVGIAIGIIFCEATIRHLRKRLRALRAQQERPNILRSITRFLFVTTQICALIWVSWSYAIATYSTVVLLQPFPAEELSKEAVRTILGVGILKVVENIFEHNEGTVFGKNRSKDNLPEASEEEGIG